jgi:hypothetical protein
VNVDFGGYSRRARFVNLGRWFRFVGTIAQGVEEDASGRSAARQTHTTALP